MENYIGWKMSKDAYRAYKRGEMPKSKWTKAILLECVGEAGMLGGEISRDVLSKLSLKTLREVLLKRTDRHNTGKYGRNTVFYDFNSSALTEWTLQKLLDYDAECRKRGKSEKERYENLEKRAVCRYLVWPETTEDLTPREKEAIGTIKGRWFFPDGTNIKKSINAKGFKIVRYA